MVSLFRYKFLNLFCLFIVPHRTSFVSFPFNQSAVKTDKVLFKKCKRKRVAENP